MSRSSNENETNEQKDKVDLKEEDNVSWFLIQYGGKVIDNFERSLKQNNVPVKVVQTL